MLFKSSCDYWPADLVFGDYVDPWAVEETLSHIHVLVSVTFKEKVV